MPAAPESRYERDEASYPGPEEPGSRVDGADAGPPVGPTGYGEDPDTGRPTASGDPTPPRAAVEPPATRPETRVTIPEDSATDDVRSAVTHPARVASADDPPARVFERVEVYRASQEERADTALGGLPPQHPASIADVQQPTRAFERPPDLRPPPARQPPVTTPVVAASTRSTSVPDESAVAPVAETGRAVHPPERLASEIGVPPPPMSDALLIPTADRPVLTADTRSSLEAFQRPNARRSSIDVNGSAPAPASVVHVTIGRVEVRAQLSSSQPRIPVRSTPDATGLDAYLRARAKGDRR
jgi:hypothetical protein